MSRGLYTAASGLVAGMERQSTLANALANVNTPGYKAELFTTRSFPGVFLSASGSGALRSRFGTLSSGVVTDRLGLDLGAGAITPTGATFDLAIDGDGFFVLQDFDGNLRLTSDGHFRADARGVLVSSDGWQVQSRTNGPISVAGGAVEIGRGGVVRVAGEAAGVIRLAAAPAGGLLHAGDSTFLVGAGEELTEATGEIVQGSLEGSNVNSTQLLTQMVSVSRAYESAQRMFAMHNRIMGLTATDVGRV